MVQWFEHNTYKIHKNNFITNNIVSENILLSVDDHVYGTIVPPLGGFTTEKDKLKLDNTDSWKGGSMIAPFDKEARYYFYFFVPITYYYFHFVDVSDAGCWRWWSLL